MFALRAKCDDGHFRRRETNRLAGVTTPLEHGCDRGASIGNTASTVAPSRSRAHEDGNVLEEQAGVLRLAAPLARPAGKIGASALEQFQDERLVRLDNSSQRLGLVQGGRAEKTVTPAERRAGMDIAALGGLRHAGSLDHRLGVIEPALLFAQSRHRRLGQGVEGAPAALAAIARHSVRPAPGDDVPPAAVGQPRRSTLPWPTAPSASSRTRRSEALLPLVAFAGQAPGCRVSPDPPGSGAAPSSTSLASQSASSACRRWAGLSLAIPVNQSSNSALFTPTSAN